MCLAGLIDAPGAQEQTSIDWHDAAVEDRCPEATDVCCRGVGSAIPAAAAHTEAVVRDIASRYALDGIHFDYARYPTDRFDYSRAAIAQVRAAIRGTLPAERRKALDAEEKIDLFAYPDAFPAEWRNFRVSRISRAAPDNNRAATADFSIPPGFDLREHARTRQPWELGDGDAIDAVVEVLSTSGATMAAAALGGEVAGMPAQRRYSVRRADAFARWMLSLGGGVRPVSPAAIVDEYRRQLDATCQVYSS